MTRRRSLLRLGRLGLLVGTVVALVGAATSCAVAPAGLAVTTVLSNRDHVWDMAFAPDGTMLFTERPGRVSAVVSGSVHQLAAPSDVVVVAESGMMGLAVDPQFASNRYVYTCFTSNISGNRDHRVVRWTVDAGYNALANRTDILTGIPASSSGVHAGCRTRFGPDGYLWVTTGDAATGTVPQDKQSLGGKVLRIDRNGNGAPGNPGVVNPGSGFRPQIYTYGHRNPQGVGFRPSDGKAYSVEHGPDRDDEINLLEAGANYGWDPHPDGGTSYDQTRPMTDKVRWPAAKDAVWSSGSPTIAPSGGTFLSGSQWAGWNNAFAIAVLKGSQLRVVLFDGPGTNYLQWIDVTDRGRLRVAVQGPDGDLYLAQDAGPGSILRVHPS